MCTHSFSITHKGETVRGLLLRSRTRPGDFIIAVVMVAGGGELMVSLVLDDGGF